MFQYGNGEVQKFAWVPTIRRMLDVDNNIQSLSGYWQRTLASDAPNGYSRGTDSENTPDSMYDSQRFTIAYRCSRDSWDAEASGVPSRVASSGKNVGDRRDAVVDLKSGGVTSETNHGISLGLPVALDGRVSDDK